MIVNNIDHHFSVFVLNGAHFLKSLLKFQEGIGSFVSSSVIKYWHSSLADGRKCINLSVSLLGSTHYHLYFLIIFIFWYIIWLYQTFPAKSLKLSTLGFLGHIRSLLHILLSSTSDLYLLKLWKSFLALQTVVQKLLRALSVWRPIDYKVLGYTIVKRWMFKKVYW